MSIFCFYCTSFHPNAFYLLTTVYCFSNQSSRKRLRTIAFANTISTYPSFCSFRFSHHSYRRVQHVRTFKLAWLCHSYGNRMGLVTHACVTQYMLSFDWSIQFLISQPFNGVISMHICMHIDLLRAHLPLLVQKPIKIPFYCHHEFEILLRDNQYFNIFIRF